MKWKMMLIGAVIAIIAVLIILLFAATSNKNKRENQTTGQEEIVKTEETDKIADRKNAIEFSEFERLTPYMSDEQLQRTKSKIKEFISEDTAYDQVTIITCMGVIQTENKVEFYCTFDQVNGSVLYGSYDKADDELLQWTEDTSGEETKKKWEEKKAQSINTKDWTEEEELPQEWNYVEEVEKGETSSELNKED